jgi:hypothetical protein
MIADAAFDADELRQRLRRLQAKVCIKPNPTRKRKKRYDRRRVQAPQHHRAVLLPTQRRFATADLFDAPAAQ